MYSGILTIPGATPFSSMDGAGPLAGRAIKFIAVLGLHAALFAWIVHTRLGPSEAFKPIRVSVRMVEIAAPPPAVAVPEPVAVAVAVAEPPKPLPQVVRAPEPVKRPAPAAVRKAKPQQPIFAAPPQSKITKTRTVTASIPAATAVRYDAVYLNNPAPVYPFMSRRKGEQGKVLLRVQVSAQGAAERVEIQASSGHPRLDSAALEAVKRWRFVPARRGGEAVAASVVVPIVFRLDGRERISSKTNQTSSDQK